MQKEDMDSDLIGFDNNYPVMKKLKLAMEGVGKPIILNSNQLSGKVFLLNNKNVKIPVKLCGAVPENVRRVVLSKLPPKIAQDQDKKRVEPISKDKHPYLSTHAVKDKPATSLNSGTSHGSGNLDNGKPTAVTISKCDSVAINIKQNIHQQSDIDKTKRFKEKLDAEKTIETTKTKQPLPMDKTALDRKRKRRILSRQQTIKREVMKCFKQSMKSQLKSLVRTRSISCQTESESRNASSQTDHDATASDGLSMDFLTLFEEPNKEISLEVLPFGGSTPWPLEGGASSVCQTLYSHETTFGNADGADLADPVDPRKRRFYEYLKNCNSTDPAGHIPLHIAVLNQDFSEVSNQCLLLKARNISVDIPNNNGMTPLHLAVLNECEPKIVETLLSNGADPLTKDNEGNTSLHNAVLCNGASDILVTLLENVRRRDEPIDVFNYEGFTPLMLCVIEDKYTMASKCVSAGADPNTKDQKSGRTSLFHAVENNNLEMVKLFMNNGANTKIKNFFGTSTHEATFELENINPEIKSLIIGKESSQNRSKPSVSRGKKHQYKVAAENARPTMKNKLKTVRILKIIEKEASK